MVSASPVVSDAIFAAVVTLWAGIFYENATKTFAAIDRRR